MSITLTKIPNHTAAPVTSVAPCSWCDDTATLKITDQYGWVDLTCLTHAVEWFDASPVTVTPRCEICGGRGCSH